jgi:hypothetical protein
MGGAEVWIKGKKPKRKEKNGKYHFRLCIAL